MSREHEAFDKLSTEEKKQLAVLGNMLAQPLDPEDIKMQELLDQWVDYKAKEEDK